MQDVPISINRNASLGVRQVGRLRTPVIVIDDFAADTGALVDFACESAEYGPDATSKYPGVRARLPRSYVRAVLSQLYRLLFQVYAVPVDLGMKPVNAVFSLITTPEDCLESVQRAPHFDSNSPYYLAVLHYLNPGPFCDTGLFRHRATGLEKILEADLDRYMRACQDHMDARGVAEKAYVKGSNDQYELYERIGYRTNRLVVYPGCLLHSGLVDPAVDINPDPRTGRLTANIFVDFFPLDEANPA